MGDNLDFLSSYGVQGLGHKENESHNSTKTHIDIKSICKQDSRKLSHFKWAATIIKFLINVKSYK